MLDPFECLQKEYTPTAQVSRQWRFSCISGLCCSLMTQVLDHADHELNVVQGGVLTKEGGRKPVRICLLAGAGNFRSPHVLACAKHIVDLLETMTTPVGHPDCETSAR